jgi:4-diphosphocytidyl-2-C-methyl-D-erythritol kinase
MTRLDLAPAKLNLALRILAREESGFHQIETIFCAIELADEIEIATDCDGICLEVRSPPDDPDAAFDLGEPRNNLAWRAAALFHGAVGTAPTARIVLTKRIPAGAGLGGGSSDAAAVLRGLNALHEQPLSSAGLLELGAQLGSDVPFFLTGSQLALAWGRGTRMLPLPKLPSRPVLLAVPDFAVSTADAYRRIAESRPADYAAPPTLIHEPRSWDDLAALASNDFEEIVFAMHPQLRTLRDDMEAAGASVARMTGTGSVVFGIFEEVAEAEHAQRIIKANHPRAACTLTRTA